MKEIEIIKALSGLTMGGLKYFYQVKSTNDVAVDWAMEGAPDLSVVYAEGQTQGKGRNGRTWITIPEVALAFSVIIQTKPWEKNRLQKYTALGALAVCRAVESLGIPAKIKWPNDVLLNGRKFCGILAETGWLDAQPLHVVIGIGVNVYAASVPDMKGLNFPATSLETEGWHDQDRLQLMRSILEYLISWRPYIAQDRFINAWEECLAYREEKVSISDGLGGDKIGWIDGLNLDGSLRLRSTNGETFSVQVGEIHLHPLV